MKVIVTLLLLCCPALAHAKDKPTITVRLKITEPNFRDYPNMPQVEKDMLTGCITYLNEMLPVFKFQATPADDTLYISIERRKTTGRIIDVDFILQLSGKNVMREFKQGRDTTTLELAPDNSCDEYLKDDPKQFVDEVVSKFKRQLTAAALIDKQMQCFLIAGCVSGKPDFVNQTWSLSYTHTDLHLGITSLLRVTHIYKIPSTSGSGSVILNRLFLGVVKSTGSSSPIAVVATDGDKKQYDQLSKLKEQYFSKVIGIQIVEFKPFDSFGPSR